MTELMFSSILRGIVSNLMIALLIFSLARPKYGRRVMFSVIAASVLLDVGVNIYFYINGDYSALAKFDFFKLLILWILLKPLFRDSFMQWSFTFLTTMNIEIIIIVLSYRLRVFFPYPMYTHTLIRLCLFLLVIWTFRRFLRPYYRKVVENWSSVFYLVAAIFLNFSYYIFAGGGMIDNMNRQLTPLLLLIILGVTAYAAIFAFLKKISSESTLREESLVASMQQKILKTELQQYQEFISEAKQNRHDLRHHNTIIAEYLTAGDLEGAMGYLNQYNNSIAETSLQMYCENPTVNMLLRVYNRRASESGVRFEIFAQIPEVMPLTDTELGTLLSNLLENAIEACEKCEEGDQSLVFVAKTVDDNLELELQNSVCGTVNFVDGLPISTKNGGGTGTKSIRRIVEKYDGMLRFQQKEQTFVTQVLLPVK